MFSFCKLFLVFAALLSVAAARPSLIGPAIIPAAVSHQSVSHLHAGPVVVASSLVPVVHGHLPLVAGPIVAHPGIHPVVLHGWTTHADTHAQTEMARN